MIRSVPNLGHWRGSHVADIYGHEHYLGYIYMYVVSRGINYRYS